MRRRAGGLLRPALLALAVLASPTLATAAIHPFDGVVARGTPAVPPGPLPQPFDGACGLALDGEAQLYVSDYHNGFVAIFGGGLFEARIPAAAEGNSACGLAVDSAGRVYASRYHGGVVRYDPDLHPFPPWVTPSYSAPTTVDSERATGVAVDPDTDVLYVAHRDRVAAYGPDGALTMTIGAGTLEDGYGVAVSDFAATDGYVYVGDAATGTVKVYDPGTDPSTPIAEIDGSQTPQGRFNDLTDTSLAVDQASGNVLVVDNLQPGQRHPAAAVNEFAPDGSYFGQLPIALVHGGPSGLAVGDRVYVSSGNEVVYDPATETESGSVVYAFALATEPGSVLRVARAGTGNGTVTSQPARISCGAACAVEVRTGSTVTLHAAPAAASRFGGWQVDGQPNACTGTGGCPVAVDATTEVTAIFEALPPRPAVTEPPVPAGQAAPAPQAATAATMPSPPALPGALAAERLSLRGAVARLTLSVPSAGSVSAAGRRLRPARVEAAGAGRVTLRLRLARSGRKALRQRGRLRVAVEVTFAPAGGGPAQSLTKVVTFRRGAGKGAR